MFEAEPGRMIRVNKLLRQTLSDILRSRWRQQAVAITLTEVDTSPDLYDAKVFYSVLTDDKALGVDFFRQHKGELSKFLAREITLKRTPRLHFIYDATLRDAARVEKLLLETQSPPASLPTAMVARAKPLRAKPSRTPSARPKASPKKTPRKTRPSDE